jgi:hypothetical protein
LPPASHLQQWSLEAGEAANAYLPEALRLHAQDGDLRDSHTARGHGSFDVDEEAFEYGDEDGFEGGYTGGWVLDEAGTSGGSGAGDISGGDNHEELHSERGAADESRFEAETADDADANTRRQSQLQRHRGGGAGWQEAGAAVGHQDGRFRDPAAAEQAARRAAVAGERRAGDALAAGDGEGDDDHSDTLSVHSLPRGAVATTLDRQVPAAATAGSAGWPWSANARRSPERHPPTGVGLGWQRMHAASGDAPGRSEDFLSRFDSAGLSAF